MATVTIPALRSTSNFTNSSCFLFQKDVMLHDVKGMSGRSPATGPDRGSSRQALWSTQRRYLLSPFLSLRRPSTISSSLLPNSPSRATEKWIIQREMNHINAINALGEMWRPLCSSTQKHSRKGETFLRGISLRPSLRSHELKSRTEQ